MNLSDSSEYSVNTNSKLKSVLGWINNIIEIAEHRFDEIKRQINKTHLEHRKKRIVTTEKVRYLGHNKWCKHLEIRVLERGEWMKVIDNDECF